MRRLAVAGRERGVALIIVLGLVALIGAWASSAAYEDLISLRRAENMMDAMRAMQASESALALAVLTLRQDARESNTDDLDEAWAMEAPPFPIDDGVVSGQIADTARFLNINDLVDAKGVAREEVVGEFRRLFALLELDGALLDALVDWLDADDRPYGAGGAESGAYYDRPYRVKNAPLDNWGELAMIKGFDTGVMARLAEVAVVTPSGGMTPVNLNTASQQVLLALFPKMTDVDAQALMAARPYADVASALQGRSWAAGVNQTRLSVSSGIFIVRTEARFGRVVFREEFIVHRQSDKLNLVSRRRLVWRGA